MSQVDYEFKDRNLEFLNQPVFVFLLPKQHLSMIKYGYGSRIHKIDNKRD